MKTCLEKLKIAVRIYLAICLVGVPDLALAVNALRQAPAQEGVYYRESCVRFISSDRVVLEKGCPASKQAGALIEIAYSSMFTQPSEIQRSHMAGAIAQFLEEIYQDKTRYPSPLS